MQFSGVFPKWKRTFSEFTGSYKSLKHELAQFKDPVSHMCLTGAVVESFFLTHEVAGSNP